MHFVYCCISGVNAVQAAPDHRRNGSNNPFGNTISFDFQSDEAASRWELSEEAPNAGPDIPGLGGASKTDQGGCGGVFKWGLALHSEI